MRHTTAEPNEIGAFEWPLMLAHRVHEHAATIGAGPHPTPEQLARTPRQWLDEPVAELEAFGVTIDALGCLEGAGIIWIRDLLQYRTWELATYVNNFSQGRLRQVYQALERIGFPTPTSLAALLNGSPTAFAAYVWEHRHASAA